VILKELRKETYLVNYFLKKEITGQHGYQHQLFIRPDDTVILRFLDENVIGHPLHG